MKKYKGIILAGGSGTRLHPITLGVSKQLLPVYDKPLIYYPLSVLMLAGIQDILLISTPKDLPNYQAVLGDGSKLGIKLSYAEQPNPNGIPEAFIIGEDFIGDDNCCLILGDNLFYGPAFTDKLRLAASKEEGSTVFCYHVNDPEQFGVAELGKGSKVVSLEEKPARPKSNFALTGLYFCDNKAVKYARELHPSQRGELEITDLLDQYLSNQMLSAKMLGRGFAWLDTGTHDSLLKAGQFVQTIEMRQGLKIACLEEIAYRNQWIDLIDLKQQFKQFQHTSYGNYLLKILNEEMPL